MFTRSLTQSIIIISMKLDMKRGEVVSLIFQDCTKVFKALSDENRLLILKLLQSGERCSCNLLDDMQIGQSTLSHHMKVLCDSGIVEGRKEGKWTHYSISLEGRENAKELLNKLTETKQIINECSDK